MKPYRRRRWASPMGRVRVSDGQRSTVELPLFPGLFKHAGLTQLKSLLQDPSNARDYTVIALQRGSWHVVRHFPREWLRECLRGAELPAPRRAALVALIEPDPVS